MTTIVNDIANTVTLAGLTGAQFVQLATTIRLGRKSADAKVRRRAAGLHLFIPGTARCEAGVTALLQLSFEEMFDLHRLLAWMVDLVPRQHRPPIADEALKPIEGAIETILTHRDEERFGTTRG